MERIYIDTNIRFQQLNRIEDYFPDNILRPSQESRNFFHGGEKFFYLKKESDNKVFFLDKGLQGIKAYKYSSRLVISCYFSIIMIMIIFILRKLSWISW